MPATAAEVELIEYARKARNDALEEAALLLDRLASENDTTAKCFGVLDEAEHVRRHSDFASAKREAAAAIRELKTGS